MLVWLPWTDGDEVRSHGREHQAIVVKAILDSESLLRLGQAVRIGIRDGNDCRFRYLFPYGIDSMAVVAAAGVTDHRNAERLGWRRIRI